MFSHNYRKAADTPKIFRINLLVLILLLGWHACLDTEVSAQETGAKTTEARSFDQGKGNSASRLKKLETHLELLERRLQALEGKDPLNGEADQASEKGTGISEPSLEDLERQVEKLEQRLAAVEKSSSPGEETPSKHFLTRHQDGFYLYADEGAGFQMRLGGGLQADYRHYAEDDRADNRFDIRRARLNLSGRLFHLLGYRASYEFEGNEPQNLLDAYGEIGIYGPNALKFGQFKVPFGLEWQTSYKDLFFAERSMGLSLVPRRDVGLGLYGHFFEDTVNYAIGIFNGDGTDGSSRGNDNDDPLWAGRFVIAPFKKMSSLWFNTFQIGGSATYENIDVSNVDLDVKSTGMVDTNLSLYVLNANTKFGVLYDAGEMLRTGLEAAWTFGPLSIQGEYMHLTYTDLKDSSGSSRDADFSSWYASAVFWLTGEQREFLHGIPQALKPKRNFDPGRGSWGALGIGCRIEHFSGDKDWINEDAFVSVSKADAFSGAVNWVWNPVFALVLDYTYTDLSGPIRVRTNPDGSVDYIDEEHVLTFRSQLVF